MKVKQQRGVALVITLIMLSLVTLMAVVFLAISRREKASVTVTIDQTDARLMADAALARAQAEVVARMMSSTNRFAYDFAVSTNFINPAGFQRGVQSLLNVNYFYPNGAFLNSIEDQLQNQVNLQIDPRPPVFVRDDLRGTLDFRFYMDFNRNGVFDPNGIRPIMGNIAGQFYTTNGTFRANPRDEELVFQNFAGDPEWIGVLERPELPHSDTNRFIGRYAYVVLPAGKMLDVNYIHNNAKFLDPNLLSEGFNRNQGHGSWELNLAGFLRDLNTNVWLTYNYQTHPFFSSIGDSFEDARAMLFHRYWNFESQNRRLNSINDLFGIPGSTAFRNDGIDGLADGPMMLTSTRADLDRLPPGDLPAKPWPGSPNPQGYFDVQEFYNADLTSAQMVNRLRSSMTNLSSYNRYTYYRLLSQLGTDSVPALSNQLFQADHRRYYTNKLHLNYRQDVPGGVTNFFSWEPIAGAGSLTSPVLDRLRTQNPIDFFYQAGDRLLRSSLVTNVIGLTNNARVALLTNFFLGTMPVRDAFCLTNIQLFHIGTDTAGRLLPFYLTNNEYTASTHRLLQVAANIYDASTRRPLRAGSEIRDYASVFRPIFQKTLTNVTIAGYVEEVNSAYVDRPQQAWRTVEEFGLDRSVPPGIYTNLNLYGAPWVIGAKKGFPNFNEFSSETAVQVSRKLEVLKLAEGSFRTNQMYVIGISNIFGAEAWNSYTQDFRHALELRVTNRFSIALTNLVNNSIGRIRWWDGVAGTTMTLNSWTNRNSPASFVVPIHTNLLFLTNSAYLSTRLPFLFNPNLTNNFENSFDPPEMVLFITNRLQYMLVDRTVVPNRVIDFVNLDDMVSVINIGASLVADRTGQGSRIFADQRLTESDLWDTNRVAFRGPTVGVINQIGVALGDPNVGADIWRSHLPDPVAGADKQKAIEKFRDFFRPGSTNLAIQVPFTPTRKIYEQKSWQVNDPLVRFTSEDLQDPLFLGNTNVLSYIRPANAPLPQSNLGLLNERYRPWGGNPNKTPDAAAYRMTIKDPLVTSSDDWDFPTNKFANVGWLGRVHRGTPWQTLYLKAGSEDLRDWLVWSGSLGTHPTNDWKFVDLFTVAPNEAAARGLLSVNQTNIAAWSAVFSGVPVVSNSIANPGPITGVRFDDIFAAPNSPQLRLMVEGINRTRAQFPRGVFEHQGDVLATPELTIASPFLNLTTPQRVQRGLTDQAVERIPQQVMSLLKADEPRLVIYAFGQSLRPADQSLVTAGNFFNICTNYQITGEFFTKAVVRIEDAPHKPRAVIESFNILQPE